MIQRLYRGVPWASKPTRRDNYPAGNIDADNTGKVLGFRLVRNLIDAQGDDREDILVDSSRSTSSDPPAWSQLGDFKLGHD